MIESLRETTRAVIKYKHELSGDVREGAEGKGKILCDKRIGGFSLYRVEKYDKCYQQTVFLSFLYVNNSKAGPYINASTAGQSETRIHHIIAISLLRLFGLFLFLPTWNLKYSALGINVTPFMVMKTIILSIGMVGLDYTSDIVTGWQHYLLGDYSWSFWTLGVILLPGFIHFIEGAFSKDHRERWWVLVGKLIFWSIFFQFLILRNFFITLFEPNYLAISVDKDGHKRIARNKYVESVNKNLSQKNMEAFVEAGMQMCLQSYIILKRGHAPQTQLISLGISFLTLSKASSENHITTQSMLLEPSIMQTIKMFPLFLLPCVSKVLTIALVLALTDVSPVLGLLFPIILLLGNTCVMWWIVAPDLERSGLEIVECMMSGLCGLLTTAVMIKESSARVTQIAVFKAYATCQTLSSAISIIWLCKLIHNHRVTDNRALTDIDNQIMLPISDFLQEIIFVLISVHILSALLFNLFNVFAKPGKGIDKKEFTGIFPTKKIPQYQHADCTTYVTTCIISNEIAMNLPSFAVGSNTSILPPGTTVRASLDVFKGNPMDSELTFCRFDKILVLNWRDDGKHHRKIWLRGRIVSRFMDADERSERYGIASLPVDSEGYFPAHVAFYDIIQSSPRVEWWWVRAVDQYSLARRVTCRTGGSEDQCSGVTNEEETAQVSYSCSSCPTTLLCGWCWVNCHQGHKGEVDLDLQGNHPVPWAGRLFTCLCSHSNHPTSLRIQ
eukprot:GFUD01007934.1.p1 GENE.GFUD01007934.1~~GFUD01007934.1.p1  ORF type:complete len:727 (-),score=126.89 GFUD01007934.1:47-2227(-)